MRRILSISILLVIFQVSIFCQVPGDTIFVQAFDYKSSTRDTIVEFPDLDLSYEKIIMRYNMRCKGALVSTPSERNKGCGEWDYSCNTYIVDSAKIEKVASVHPNYIIGNFEETEYPYTSQQTHDYYSYSLTNTELVNVISEDEFQPLLGDDGDYSSLQTDQNSGRSFSLYTAEELGATGMTAGSIDALRFWVVNQGGNAGFLKISMKHSDQETLSKDDIDFDDFTEVFSDNHYFYGSLNTLVLKEPFVWDGTSNIIIQLSFTNSEKSEGIALNGTFSNSAKSLYSSNNYSIDLAQQASIKVANDALQSVEDEFSVAFWSFGDEDLLPANTTILYGYDSNSNNRDLNIHLPWGNSAVFFDCGFNGGYDRISKIAAASDFSGKWNHWAFTKNATTGSMKMYLNGSLWTSSLGNNNLVNLMELIIGSNQNGGSNYKGKINELSVWNSELSVEEIQMTLSSGVADDHPAYDNLVSYYPMNEGVGAEIVDAKSGEIGTGSNVFWTYERGDQLTRGFKETLIRPNLVFLRGEYETIVTETESLDSIARNPNTVSKYYVEDNEGELKHDDIILESSEYLYESSDQNVYDGETGDLLSTIPVVSEGTILIEDLNYFRRFPFYNEIISFVTPYGIGIDFGENGKSWYYDVSDFKPLLKGDKRISMTLGGQRQEEMDISFMFIVGTPPREVIEFNQLWQGTNRTGAARINAINNDERYAPLDVEINAEAVDFVLKSTITGHGAQGEFQQNGGQFFMTLILMEITKKTSGQ